MQHPLNWLRRLALAAPLGLLGATLFPFGSAPAQAALERASALSCVPESECCKICSKGKACGNSCISESKSCHNGRGCACDAEEICR